MPTLDGVLFFPVTPFDAHGGLHTDALSTHIEQGVAAGAGAVFVACGTGEFHALSPDECTEATRTAVATVASRVPVLTGCGGPISVARTLAHSAADSGVDGLLLLPPYLVSASPQGLADYVEAIANETDLPIIVYQRNNAQFDEEAAVRVARHPNVVGFKDGTGDLDRLARIVAAIRQEVYESGKSFQFFSGMPTAELTIGAYRGIGISLYSSAVFAFAPDIAMAFYQATRAGDVERADHLLKTFFVPFVRLRDQQPGYAVSLVKAGVALLGLDAGSVRPPLQDPSPEHIAALAQLLNTARADLGTMPSHAVTPTKETKT